MTTLTVEKAKEILNMEETKRIKIVNGLSIEDLVIINRVMKLEKLKENN